MRKLNNQEIIDSIKEIAKHIDDGYSIALAKKKVVGSDSSYAIKQVMRHPLYIELLNHYSDMHNLGVTYFYDQHHPKGARIVSKKRKALVN